MAVAALLLAAPQAFASRTASARPELLAGPAIEQAPAAAHALAVAYTPRGFELHASTDPRPAAFALFDDLTPASERLEPEKLASGVASWELTPNLQRIQKFVAETWWVREHLGPVDSPNLYQAFGLDPQNNTDPMGLRVPNAQDKRIRQRLVARLEELDRQWSMTGSASATMIDTEARAKCLLCTENEYVSVARERSASTEAEYQELRTRLAREVTDFDTAVAKADKDDVIHFRGGGLQGEGPYYTVFTKIDAVSNAEAMAWFNVGASEQVAVNVIYLSGGVSQQGRSGADIVRRQAMTPATRSASTALTKRQQYMGRTPGKGSRTGRDVITRMLNEGTVVETADGKLQLRDANGNLIPLSETDMGHLEDAVKWWNREGYKYGPKSEQVRRWMRDPNNYELQPSPVNRSNGARLQERYRPPEVPE